MLYAYGNLRIAERFSNNLILSNFMKYILAIWTFFTSEKFNEHRAWRLTCIAVHLKCCIMYVYIFISHLCACTVNVKLICITAVKPWAVWSIRFPFLAYGLLGVDQVWWIKWWQDIILNYWGKQRQCDMSKPAIIIIQAYFYELVNFYFDVLLGSRNWHSW